MIDGLDHFAMSDQPTTCGQCGARTGYVDLTPRVAGCSRQHHTCPDCKYEFIVEEQDTRGCTCHLTGAPCRACLLALASS